MTNPTFYESFKFLDFHTIFNEQFQYGCLEVQVVLVNPKTKEVDQNVNLNTEVNVRLECGPKNEESDFFIHDYDLDCGATTYEEAIIKLAFLVKEKYGEYVIGEPTEEEIAYAASFFEKFSKKGLA